MADERENVEESAPSTRGGTPRRGGYGDDQGTRVGSPDPGSADGSEREGRGPHTGPSTQPVKEGLEGAVLEDDEHARDR